MRSWVRKGRYGGRTDEPRPLRTVVRKNGYVRAYFGYRGLTRDVHVLVAKAFHGPKPVGKEVAHKNNIRSDNRAENLEWKTRKENQKDRRRHGTHGRTLSQEVVDQIRTAYIPGETTQKQVAEQFGVTQSTVSKIHLNRIWVACD